MPETPTTVFISYARANTDFVDHLEADLQMRGFHTWVDRRKLEGGQDWLNSIQHAIEQCQVLLVILSPDAVESKYVIMEYRHAFRMGKPVIPLQYRLCPKVPMDLNDIQWIDFMKPYDDGLSELLVVLSRIENTEPEMQKASPSLGQSQALYFSDEKEPDLVAPQPAPPPPEPDLDELYRAGVKAMSEGDLERAVVLWQQIYDRDPNFKSGTFAAQREKLLQKLYPLRIQRLREKAEEASKAGDWGQEISMWEALLRLNMWDSQAQIRIALAKENQKYAWHYENALQFVQEGLLPLAQTELEMLWDVAPYYGDPRQLTKKIGIEVKVSSPADFEKQKSEMDKQKSEMDELQVIYLEQIKAKQAAKRKTVSGFVELELETVPVVTWIALLCLLSGISSAVGMLVQPWYWSVGTVGAVMILAYGLGYRRAIHPLIVLGIAAISCSIAFGLTEYTATFPATPQTSGLWLIGQRIFWDWRQVDFGLLIGAASSILSFIYVFVNDDFGWFLLSNIGFLWVSPHRPQEMLYQSVEIQPYSVQNPALQQYIEQNLAFAQPQAYGVPMQNPTFAPEIYPKTLYLRGFLAGVILGLLFGLIAWAVLALIASIFGWGFGFGGGWYISLIGLAVGIIGGAGLGALFVVCRLAYQIDWAKDWHYVGLAGTNSLVSRLLSLFH